MNDAADINDESDINDDSAGDAPDAAARFVEFDRVAREPAALLPLAAIAIVAFGGLHLIVDLFAFSGDFMGQLGGVLTDSHTVVTGVALVVCFSALVAAPVPSPVGSWRVLSWVPALRSAPERTLHRVMVVLLAVGVAQTVIAAANAYDGDRPTAVIVTHDLFYVTTVAAVVTLLIAVAVSRSSAPDWSRAPAARQALAGALFVCPALGLLLTILWLAELWDFDTRGALVVGSFALLETVVATAVLVVANVVVRSAYPADPASPDRVTPGRSVSNALDNSGDVLRWMVPVSVVIGALHVLLAVGHDGEFSAGLGFVAFANSSFDVVAIVVGVLLLRQAGTRYGVPNLLAVTGAGGAPQLDQLMRVGVYLVAYLGVFSALVSAWVFRGDAGEVWYYFFNRLVRTAIVLGVLFGIRAIHLARQAFAGPPVEI